MSNENVKTYTGAIKARGSLKGAVNAGTVIKIPGLDGVTYTPYVDELGTLSWTNDMGLPNPDPVSIRGPKGIQGEPGKDYILTEADKAIIAELTSVLVKVHIDNLINTTLGVIENGTY